MNSLFGISLGVQLGHQIEDLQTHHEEQFGIHFFKIAVFGFEEIPVKTRDGFRSEGTSIFERLTYAVFRLRNPIESVHIGMENPLRNDGESGVRDSVIHGEELE